MMTRGWIQILLKAGHRRSASETPFEWYQRAFRWRADAAGPSLNARMITVTFQGIRTRKPYTFVIFGGGDGVWIRGCPMAANLLAFVHFYRCSHCIRGLPNNVVLSIRTRTSRRKKISCRQHLYVRGVALCCVLEQDTFILVLALVKPRKTRPDISEKNVDWEVKNQIKQTHGRSQRVLSR